MNEKNPENLIDQLVNDLRPVRSYWTAEKRTIVFLFLNFTALCLLMLPIGPFRPGLLEELTHILFVIEGLLFFGCLVSLSYLFFLSLVPGAFKKSKLRWALGLFILFVSLFVFKINFSNSFHASGVHRPLCYLEVIFLSLIPFSQLFYFVKKGCFHQNRWSFSLASLNAGLFPAFLMHFMCLNDNLHILFFHIAPSLFVFLAGMFFFAKKIKSM